MPDDFPFTMLPNAGFAPTLPGAEGNHEAYVLAQATFVIDASEVIDALTTP